MTKHPNRSTHTPRRQPRRRKWKSKTNNSEKLITTWIVECLFSRRKGGLPAVEKFRLRLPPRPLVVLGEVGGNERSSHLSNPKIIKRHCINTLDIYMSFYVFDYSRLTVFLGPVASLSLGSTQHRQRLPWAKGITNNISAESSTLIFSTIFIVQERRY